MDLNERAAYLKGLMDGLEIDEGKKEGKVLKAMYELLAQLCDTVTDLDADLDQAYDELDAMDEDMDELIPDAIEVVLSEGQASVSQIQRKLKVGYARAGRIIDTLETMGIVGPHEGSKPRRVLVGPEYLDEQREENDESTQ